ncbi:hypothetical protein ABPG75_011947 [Micractinium tetrahymenae]
MQGPSLPPLAAAPASRVLLLALASRLVVLGAMLLADWSFADLDSSARLQGYPCAGASSSGVAADGQRPTHKPPLGVWDTVYFARVARCGYETDKINAFFPGLPAAMRAGGAALAGLAALLGAPRPALEAAYAAAGLALNVAAFCLGALCLHRLSLRVLAGSSTASSSRASRQGAGTAPAPGGGRRRSARLSSLGAGAADGSGMPGGTEQVEQQEQRGSQQPHQGRLPRRSSKEQQQQQQQGECIADLALLFFCCNPASVFYSAAYSEALFAAATWAGLLLLPRRHWAGVAALAAASAMRSNGILGMWFPLHKALAAAAAHSKLPLREAGRAALSCAIILAPYVAMQAGAYLAHCGASAAAPPPPWCSARLPSVYAFIQKEYWDVGWLRFYQGPRRLPMVLMSVAVALLSLAGIWAYLSADWQRALTLGLFCRGGRQLPRWLGRLERALGKRCLSKAAWLRAAGARLAASTGIASRQPKAQQRRQQPSMLATVFQPLADAGPEAAPVIYHWALMTAVALLAMHVNVATRFLSACPPLYWAAGAVAARGGTPARLLWLWCFAYIVLGCILFPNFYPWT